LDPTNTMIFASVSNQILQLGEDREI
jgi:hypothetical protein